jgi:hypothetical protein
MPDNKILLESIDGEVIEKTKYVKMEISNICFNEKIDKAIVYVNILHGTFPFSVVYGTFHYLIFEKNDNWRELKRIGTWSGIS